MTRIDYVFLDGTFERVPFKKLPKQIARELLKLERRDERVLEKDCKYQHGNGYVEGDSDFQMREINYSDPVADSLDTTIQETALRDALAQPTPVWPSGVVGRMRAGVTERVTGAPSGCSAATTTGLPAARCTRGAISSQRPTLTPSTVRIVSPGLSGEAAAGLSAMMA